MCITASIARQLVSNFQHQVSSLRTTVYLLDTAFNVRQQGFTNIFYVSFYIIFIKLGIFVLIRFGWNHAFQLIHKRCSRLVHASPELKFREKFQESIFHINGTPTLRITTILKTIVVYQTQDIAIVIIQRRHQAVNP